MQQSYKVTGPVQPVYWKEHEQVPKVQFDGFEGTERFRVWTHLTRVGAPKVNARSESHSQNIVRGPVDEVEVEVVLQGGRIQDLQGRDHLRTTNLETKACRAGSCSGKAI
jgi:hypothetical protein